MLRIDHGLHSEQPFKVDLTTHIKNSVKLKDHGVAQTSFMLLLRVKMKIRLKLAELFVVLSIQFPKTSKNQSHCLQTTP